MFRNDRTQTAKEAYVNQAVAVFTNLYDRKVRIELVSVMLH